MPKSEESKGSTEIGSSEESALRYVQHGHVASGQPLDRIYTNYR